MPLPELTALLALATAMSFTPGPNTTLAAALAVNRGLRAAIPFVIGVTLGWSALLLACAMGLGAAIMAAPALRWVIQTAGVVWMLWLALQLARSARLAQAGNAHLHAGFRAGALLQCVNIKAWLLALSIAAGWIAGQPDAMRRLAVVLPVMAAFAFTSNVTYATLGALLRRWLAHGPRLLWFNRTMAALLAATAVWLGRVVS